MKLKTFIHRADHPYTFIKYGYEGNTKVVEQGDVRFRRDMEELWRERWYSMYLSPKADKMIKKYAKHTLIVKTHSDAVHLTGNNYGSYRFALWLILKGVAPRFVYWTLLQIVKLVPYRVESKKKTSRILHNISTWA